MSLITRFDGNMNVIGRLLKEYRMKKVFEIFAQCGADPEILYIHNPHIGTDLLRKVVANLRNKIISLGGTFLYNTTLTNLIIENNQIKGIEINNKDILNTSVPIWGLWVYKISGEAPHSTNISNTFFIR